MLDFFYLPDELPPPESPDEIEFAMGLCLEDFKALEGLWSMLSACGLDLSYFRDSVIPAPKVADAVDVLDQFERDIDVKTRKKLEVPLGDVRRAFVSAANQKLGLCSYSD